MPFPRQCRVCSNDPSSWTFTSVKLDFNSFGEIHTYDNSVAEAFFAVLQKELIYRRKWPEKQELRNRLHPRLLQPQTKTHPARLAIARRV